MQKVVRLFKADSREKALEIIKERLNESEDIAYMRNGLKAAGVNAEVKEGSNGGMNITIL